MCLSSLGKLEAVRRLQGHRHRQLLGTMFLFWGPVNVLELDSGDTKSKL